MSFVRFLARPMLASSFVLAGMDKLKNADDTAAQLSPLLRRAADALPFQTNEKVLARVIGGTQVGAGVCSPSASPPAWRPPSWPSFRP